ncbi:hypothetical protein E2320_023048 [Naja naja]|nr:hypothetical protein E2320_023048 [Naja naja]
MANTNEDVSDTQCIEACRECEEDELFADLTLPTDSQWGAYNRGYGEMPLQGYQEREQEECEEEELFAELSLPTDSQWAPYNMGFGENPLQGYQERELEVWWNGLMQDKFPSCSAVQSVQMGGNQQASPSKFPGDDYPSEIEQSLPATHDSEEMELQEPACKKPKRGDEEQPPTDTWNDSVSNELDMSETQTADERVPSEVFDGLNTPEEPSVYLESVQAWQRNLQHYRATEYYERYRFVNMEYVQSFTRAIDIIHNEVQRLLNRISGEISPNDFVQLRLDAEELGTLFMILNVVKKRVHTYQTTSMPWTCWKMAVRRWEWYGEKCLEEFVKTFVQPKFSGTTFIAHNSKSYDGYLVLRQLIREKAMGFQDSKGYFPHLFNMSENQDYVGPLLDAKYYSPETMMPGERNLRNGMLLIKDFNSLLDSTYGMLYRTRTREDYLKSEGYVVRCIWEHEWNDMLKNNEDYINMHLRQKQEASGYPDWCKTEEDKERYVRDYKKNEGVQLCREHIEYNPAKRQIAKLFLNSLWGKFGQSTNHLTTTVVTEPEELFMYLFVPYYEVSSCEFVDDEAAVLTWKVTKNQPTKSTCTNVFIASFTTAYARLELYSLLERWGDRCLYHDTDSVIFISREGAWSPSLGDYLGQLTSEIPPNTSITEFAAAGPKTYGYALSNGSTVLKVKGITLNSANSVKVNFESLKDLINEYCLTGGVEKKEIKMEQIHRRPLTIGTTAVSRLDSDMRDILQRADLCEDEKIKLYNSVLQRFLRLSRQNDSEKDRLNLIYPEEPRQPPTLPDPPPQASPQDTAMDEVLRGVSTRYRKNAELLLNKMKQHQDISTWDDRDLLYRGVPIPGWDAFMNAMAEVNVSTSVLGSTAIKEQIEKLKDSLVAKDDAATSPISVMKPPFEDQKSLITGTPSTPWTLNPRSRLKFGDWINW